MINARTKFVGLLGWPVEHSLSPFIHNLAFDHFKINWRYIPLPVQPGCLEQAVSGLKALNFIGVNVTIPHKVDIVKYVDELDDAAKGIGAVNTLAIAGNKVHGFNTDAGGFLNSLIRCGFTIKGKKAVLLGAGGAARAVIHSLLHNGIAEVAVGGRNQEKISKWCQGLAGILRVKAYDWLSADFASQLKDCDLIINCTPLGMSPNAFEYPPVDWSIVNSSAIAYDLIYNPLETCFLQQAKQNGLATINGLAMLIEQALLSFSIWTGTDTSSDRLYAQIESYLKMQLK